MGSTTFDWAVRLVMLVLAGLVTLSILGSIAAVSSDAGAGGWAGFDRPLVEPRPPGETEPKVPEANAAGPAEPGADPESPGAVGTGASASGSAIPAPPPDEEERWLEAIAYALLALAGIGAIGVLLLLRIARELRRIGDSRFSPPPPP